MKYNCENTTPMAFSMGRYGIVAYEATHQKQVEWDFEDDGQGNAIPIEEPELEKTEALTNVFKYAERVAVDTDNQSKRKKKKNPKIADGTRSEYFNLNQNRKYKRTCRKIKNLCKNNFYEDNATHVSLTFDAKRFPEKDFKDLKTAKAEFSKFIKRMNEHYDNFRHVTVYARQENGNWHFHMLCNLDSKTKKMFVRKIWGLGAVKILHKSNRKAVDNLVNYLCKNLKKNFDEYVDKRAFAYSEELQDNIYLRQWKLEENYIMAEVLDSISSGDIKVREFENSFYLYGSLEKYWNPIVMATLKKTKFKHKKYRPEKRKKKGGDANATEKSSEDG